MLGPLMRLLPACWRPLGDGDGVAGTEGREGLLWYRDLDRCAGGDFSVAVVQANQVLEGQSQIESGLFGTFIGVYDGHGCLNAARYVCDHLFRHFPRDFIRTTGCDIRWHLKSLSRDRGRVYCTCFSALEISARYGNHGGHAVLLVSLDKGLSTSPI